MNKGIPGLLIGLGTVAIVILIGWAALRKPAPPATPITTPPVRTDTDTGLNAVPRIPFAEARQRIASGAVTLIDVRDADSYIAGHIPGAIQIPLSRIEGEINYLPRGKPIITYCT